ncbi:carbohydrate porin [Novosphingobium sp. AP12]|uniref:carbohydrate porin n=1 Tax=Novosphingobium sp. AP12 TaxID=1144305 RepID=UPI000271D895|nr:carbohydrate porin [Novosphingobium sp. AP12]EJL31848.1 carbohydrate-selective porin [Novosphingobium sp. AP12]
MRRRITLLALAGGCALTAAAPAWADDAAADDQPTAKPAATTTAPHAAATAKPPQARHPRDTATGDWGGLRTRLKDAGVSIRADYVSETFSAVDGGLRRGTAYTQQIRAGADFDMDRIAGLSGGTIHLTLNDRRGVGLSSDFVGNRLPIQEAAGGPYARLSEASYEQDIDGGRLNLRVGFFAMGNDLGGMPIGCNLVNAAFCAHPLSMSGNSGWYNYPNARWGAAVRYRLRPDLAIRTGVYQVNPRLGEEENAFKPFVGGTTGVLLPIEAEYDPGTAPGSHAMPGHYKLGFYYDTSTAPRQANPGTVGGRFGGYILADQMILRDGGDNGARGLSVFGQFTANPEASAQITRWYAAGLVKIGTFAGRDADTVALGVVHAQVNERLRAAHADAPAAEGYASLPQGETAIELSYGFQVRRWLSIRPDVQYIADPGAFSYRETDNALALGVQVKMQI